jgi:hypothetical protein
MPKGVPQALKPRLKCKQLLIAEASIQAQLLKLSHSLIMLPGVQSSCTSMLLARVVNIGSSRPMLDARGLISMSRHLTLPIEMAQVVVGAAGAETNVAVRAFPLRVVVRVDIAPRVRDRHQ